MDVLHWLSDELGRLGPGATRLLATLLVLVGWYALYRLLRRILRRAFNRPGQRFEAGTARALARGVQVAVLLMVALFLLEIWGVSVSGLWTGTLSVFAIMGVALMAGWSLLSNATASMFLQVWRPFRRGDHLTMVPDEMAGTVIEQNMFFTVLRCEDQQELVIPNTLLFQRMVRVRRGGTPAASAEVPTDGWHPG
jgi:small-conductance mechanosensitive channel